MKIHTAVFLIVTPIKIREKIMHHAFSGGRDTAEEQRKYGADIDVDVSYQWLTYFLYDEPKNVFNTILNIMGHSGIVVFNIMIFVMTLVL
jgi:tryptophanyl-tRNA synthetase